jgi:hypothetical protein
MMVAMPFVVFAAILSLAVWEETRGIDSDT